MKRLIEAPELLRSALICVLACLLVAGAAFLVSVRLQTLEQERTHLRRWRDIEVTTERLLAVLTEAESSQRGYLLTHQSAYLAEEDADANARRECAHVGFDRFSGNFDHAAARPSTQKCRESRRLPGKNWRNLWKRPT